MDELKRHAYAADLALLERPRHASADAPDEWADAFVYPRGARIARPTTRTDRPETDAS